jgi:hypothetical protein
MSNHTKFSTKLHRAEVIRWSYTMHECPRGRSIPTRVPARGCLVAALHRLQLAWARSWARRGAGRAAGRPKAPAGAPHAGARWPWRQRPARHSDTTARPAGAGRASRGCSPPRVRSDGLAAPPFTHHIPDLLTFLVALLLKRHCNRTLSHGRTTVAAYAYACVAWGVDGGGIGSVVAQSAPAPQI